MKLQVMDVTPQQAKSWLKVNTLNRPVRDSYVNFLADAMKRGEWMVNHQPVALNGNRLIDGQHRLMAVVESGLPSVKMTVVTDADTGTFDTIDIGVKRSFGDIFREDPKVMNPITLITKILYGQRITPKIVKPVYEKLHKSMRDVVDTIPRTTTKGGWTSAPIRVAAHAAILDGETKVYVFGLYKAMVSFDTKNLPPVAASFVKQMLYGRSQGRPVGSVTHDTLARAFTVFHAENKDLDRVMVKKITDRIAEIRSVYRRNLGIK